MPRVLNAFEDRLRSLVRVFSKNDKIFRQEKKYVEL